MCLLLSSQGEKCPTWYGVFSFRFLAVARTGVSREKYRSKVSRSIDSSPLAQAEREKRMTSTTAISTIILPTEATTTTEASHKDKFAQRFRPANVKPTRPSEKARGNSSSPPSIVRELRAEDIKEHGLWALVSLVLCFFIVAPVVAYHHSRRIRIMKGNQQLARAKERSDRVSNLLVFSNIVGGIIWVALVFVLAVLLILGALYK